MGSTSSARRVDGLTDEQVAAYRRDGFLAVEALYAPDEMLQWKQTILATLEEDVYESGSGVRVWMSDVIDPKLRQAAADPHVVRILTQLIGPNVEFLSAKAVFKNAETSFASPWHQDWFYWGGASKMSIWIALDDATPENGCLKFIPGSHRKVFPKKVVDGENAFVNRIEQTDLDGLPEVTVALKRGDAAFFHDLAVHSSHPNVSGADRWSFISTYRDASVKDDSNVWQTAMLVAGKCVNEQDGGAAEKR